MPPTYIKVTKHETEEEKMIIVKQLNDTLDYIRITVTKVKGKIVSIHGEFDIYWEEKNNGQTKKS